MRIMRERGMNEKQDVHQKNFKREKELSKSLSRETESGRRKNVLKVHEQHVFD